MRMCGVPDMERGGANYKVVSHSLQATRQIKNGTGHLLQRDGAGPSLEAPVLNAVRSPFL